MPLGTHNYGHVKPRVCETCANHGYGSGQLICKLDPTDEDGYWKHVYRFAACDLYEPGETPAEFWGRPLKEAHNGKV